MMSGGAPATVPCPRCDHANRAGARFCGNCGAGLEVALACPRCGRENPPGQRFCDDCGERLLSEPAAGRPGTAAAPALEEQPPPDVALPEHLRRKIRAQADRLVGERKQVTVLFADVTGSMDLAERTDPERWREIMNELFQRLAESVHRFEGTVDKFTGDGIMALFGAPIAHEDHAQRACFAALQMRESIGAYAGELRRVEGINLSIRIGINSGEVVVGAIGDDLSLSYTAVGHTVGLAQRMEALAEPGSAYATEHTARLAAGYLELEDLGEFEIKGSSAPVRVFAVAHAGSARGRLDVARQRGFSRFVGRAAEMTELDAALERAAGGAGEVIGIVGEAGVGKSRLCHEFAERCRARGLDVYETQCQAHGRNLPLLPVLQMMRAYFGVSSDDSDREAREKIAGRLLLLDQSFAEDLGLVFDFLAVPDPERPAPQINPEARQRRLLNLVRRLVQARGREGVAVNLVEDLHWIDPASAAFLTALVEAVPGTTTLVVTNFRPEYRGEWMGRSYYRQLPLAPLGPEALNELFLDLLGNDPSLDGLAELVRERTGGNPFYVEEVVRDLAESGALAGERGYYRLVGEIDELSVPSSVQAILAARIDRLSGPAKVALQAAAAIGSDFRLVVLARVVDLAEDELGQAMRELVESEFVYEATLYPQPEYEFRHPLTREVAYESQLGATRSRTHAAIATALQELEPERADENAALIAQHYEAAGEAMAAAGWHARAAAWIGFKDPAAAWRHWQQIRELDPDLPDDPAADAMRAAARTMMLGMGWRLGVDLESQREVFEEGRAIAERRGDANALALLHGGLAIAIGTVAGNVSEYNELADASQELGARVDDPATQVIVASVPMYARYLAGRHEEALASLESVLELTADDPQLAAGIVVANPRAWATSFRAPPLIALGRFAEARRAADEGAALCRRWDRESLGWTHTFYCALAVFGGEPAGAEAIAHGRQAVEIAETIGDSFSRAVAAAWLGYALLAAGEAGEARQVLEGCLAGIGERGAGREFEPNVRSSLGRALAIGGKYDRGVEECRLAIELADARGIAISASSVRRSLAECLIERAAPGDLDEASVLLNEAERAAVDHGQRPDVALTLAVRARLLDRAGDQRGRDEARAGALELATEMDARGLLAELEAEVGQATAAG